MFLSQLCLYLRPNVYGCMAVRRVRKVLPKIMVQKAMFRRLANQSLSSSLPDCLAFQIVLLEIEQQELD
jgi:hypothetical protein